MVFANRVSRYVKGDQSARDEASSTAELQAHLSTSSTGEGSAAHRKTIPLR